jgi:hypothetical protein
VPALAIILLQVVGPILLPLFESFITSADAEVVSWFHGTTTTAAVAKGLPLVPDLATFVTWLGTVDQVTVDGFAVAITDEQVKRSGGLA